MDGAVRNTPHAPRDVQWSLCPSFDGGKGGVVPQGAPSPRGARSTSPAPPAVPGARPVPALVVRQRPLPGLARQCTGRRGSVSLSFASAVTTSRGHPIASCVTMPSESAPTDARPTLSTRSPPPPPPMS